jgi:hypothetical protein
MIVFNIKLPEPIVLSVRSDAGLSEAEYNSDNFAAPRKLHKAPQESCGPFRAASQRELNGPVNTAVVEGVIASAIADGAVGKSATDELVSVKLDRLGIENVVLIKHRVSSGFRLCWQFLLKSMGLSSI